MGYIKVQPIKYSDIKFNAFERKRNQKMALDFQSKKCEKRFLFFLDFSLNFISPQRQEHHLNEIGPGPELT